MRDWGQGSVITEVVEVRQGVGFAAEKREHNFLKVLDL